MAEKSYKAACGYVRGLLDAQTEFAASIDKALWYLKRKFPEEDYTAFFDAALIENEKRDLKDWLSMVLDESPPGADIKMLGFFIVCESLASGYNMDLCFLGEKEGKPARVGVCHIESPDYLPRKHLAHSKLLKTWASLIDDLSFRAKFFSEYLLGMTYSAFAARDLGADYAKRLQGEGQRALKAGFSLGDCLYIGTLQGGKFLLKE